VENSSGNEKAKQVTDIPFRNCGISHPVVPPFPVWNGTVENFVAFVDSCLS